MELILPVPGVRPAFESLVARGCPVRKQPHEVMPGQWAANLADPDGHLLTLFGAEQANP